MTLTKSTAAEAIPEAPATDLPPEPETATADAPIAPTHASGIDYLRDRYGVALRMWSTKGPKDVGGVISAVFLQDETPPRVVMIHQGPTRFTVWERAE